MEQNVCDREMLWLYYGGMSTETAMDCVEAVIPHPEIIGVPGAPDHIEGILYRDGRLIPVFRPGTYGKETPRGGPACVVLIRGEDEKIYGMAADEAAGGGAVGSVYR